MVRMFIRFVLSCGAAAVGLWVASLVLDRMSVSGAAFLIAVLIFTVTTAILQPLMVKIARRHVNALAGGTALVTTLAGLIITDLISDGMNIDGGTTWVLAALIVWVVSMIAGVVLPALFLKDKVENRA
jgi:putative membrane protein